MIPVSCRRRWTWGKSVGLLVSSSTFSVPATEILPSDWKIKRWALAEVRGYRAATTAMGNAAVISEIRDTSGTVLLPAGATGDGLGIDAQSGPLPLWIPLPSDWSGSLDVDAASDNGAGQSFRFMFSFVELTEAEWASLGGCP